MYRVRTVKTASGAAAVQVVEYFKNKRAVLLHVGSAKNEEELLALKESALNWIERNSQQKFLFPLVKKSDPKSSLISLDKCKYLGFRYQLLYDVLWSLMMKFNPDPSLEKNSFIKTPVMKAQKSSCKTPDS